jgi:hypothetical protein
VNSGIPEGYGGPALRVARVVLFFLHTI